MFDTMGYRCYLRRMNRPRFIVTGIGQASLDYIAVVDGYPAQDTKHEAEGLVVSGGGPVATALVGLARLNVKAFLMGVVGHDEAGKAIIKGLEDEGVDVSGVKVRKDGESQRAFIIVNRKDGTRTIVWKRPTARMLTAREIDRARISGSDMLILDGLMSEASLKAASIAREAGVPVLLDAGRVREGMMDLCALSDYVVGSAEFAAGLGLAPEEAVESLSALGCRAATITLGREGSVTFCEGRLIVQKGFDVDTLDTTGAGDVFHGGYAYGVLMGWTIDETLEFASAFAAIKCMSIGGREGIPTLGRTMRFIREKGGCRRKGR